MVITHLRLRNWRNFAKVDVPLTNRVFLVGPNASGKSNFLDVFRFLRDIAKPGGGLQKAISDRGGISKIRCLAARKRPEVEIEVTFLDSPPSGVEWNYSICIKQQVRGHRQPFLVHERVAKNGRIILERPNFGDKADEMRLTQTHLEQINANEQFRDLAKFFQSVLYLHLIPQLVRHPKEFPGPGLAGDPFGRQFLERIARTPRKTRESRLRRIESVLQLAVPQLRQLAHVTDTEEGGVPHLEVIYEHWRFTGAKQREDQFSDGTLRLIGLLWAMLEGDALLLMEEPELSLNVAIVRELPALFHRALRLRKRQIILSTHSADLLSDKGIGAEELLLLTPHREGTIVETASSLSDVRILLDSGMSAGDAVLPRTAPRGAKQLSMFE